MAVLFKNGVQACFILFYFFFTWNRYIVCLDSQKIQPGKKSYKSWTWMKANIFFFLFFHMHIVFWEHANRTCPEGGSHRKLEEENSPCSWRVHWRFGNEGLLSLLYFFKSAVKMNTYLCSNMTTYTQVHKQSTVTLTKKTEPNLLLDLVALKSKSCYSHQIDSTMMRQTENIKGAIRLGFKYSQIIYMSINMPGEYTELYV